MKVLVIADDYWHPAKVAWAGTQPLVQRGYELRWIEDAADWSAERMAGYPVVLFVKSNSISAANRDPWVTPAVEQAFADYVRGGGGLLAVHSGTASYTEKPTLRALLGGVFTHHPPECP